MGFIKSIFNSKSQLSNIVYNKPILYFMLLLSLSNLYLLSFKGEGMFALVFILIGFICSFFTKNMTIILFLSLCITNIIKGGSGLSEGFEDDSTSSKMSTEALKKETKKMAEKIKNADDSVPEGADENTLQHVKNIKLHATELLDVQNELIDNMQKIDPILNRAEKIISKFEKYKGEVKEKFSPQQKKKG
jgi:methyl-accepting chemotaxis protein